MSTPKRSAATKALNRDAGYIARMNKTWGWLIRENVAPVWIGEMGSSMMTDDERAWGRTITSYMNGLASDGLRFSKTQQPVSSDWWCWGYRPGERPDGCLAQDGKMRPEQAPYIEALRFLPKPK